jgi:hypothetical protein
LKCRFQKSIINYLVSFKCAQFAVLFYVVVDFPESPSALKKSLMYDLPLEINNLELSDTENDKSVYEAHLSSNLQNVCLTMNEKEGKYV